MRQTGTSRQNDDGPSQRYLSRLCGNIQRRTELQDIPIFAGFQSLVSGSRPYNKTIFSVVDDDKKVENALKLIEEVCGPFEESGAGIAFTLPLADVFGLKPEID